LNTLTSEELEDRLHDLFGRFELSDEEVIEFYEIEVELGRRNMKKQLSRQ